MQWSRFLASLGIFLFVFGVARSSEATNICDETVPSNRFIDGFPAYSQCTAGSSGAIYSNNGLDTSTSSGGTGWVRTQMSGGYQCTEWAHRYLYFKWNVQSVPNGNAGTWCDGTIPNGLVKTTTPAHGDLIVFAPGSCGADATTGHVAVIDVVNTNTTVTFVEQNNAGRRSCANSTAACFLHAAANSGATAVDGGVPDTSPGADTGSTSNSDTRSRGDTGPDSQRPDTSGAGDLLSVGGALGAGGALATGGSVGGGGAAGASGPLNAGGANLPTGTTGGSPGLGTGGTGGGVATLGGAGGESGASGGRGDANGPGGATSEPAGKGCSCRLAASRPSGASKSRLCLVLFVALASSIPAMRRRRSPSPPTS